MASKECDPRCTGRCNKNKLPVVHTAEKACDPRCTGRCSQKHVGTSPPRRQESLKPPQKEVFPPENIEPPPDQIPCTKQEDNIDDVAPTVAEPAPTEKQETVDTEEPQSICQKQSVSKTKVEKLSGKINCVIMDLDGVILDIETVYEFLIKDLVQKYGIADIETQRIIDLQDKETSTKFCNDYKLKVSPREFMIEFKKSALKQLANTPLMPGIENLMEYLTENNYPVAVASNSNEEAYKLKTQKHIKFFQKFSHIVLGGSDPEVKVRKPSPKVYEVCGSRFPSKPKPENILVLEDAPEGVSAAIGAGMNVIWFPNKYTITGDGKGAIAILNSINEFNPKEFGLLPMN